MKFKITTAFLLLILTSAALLAQENSSQDKSYELNILILQSKYQEALDLSDKLLKDEPDNADYLYTNAMINRMIFRYNDALEAIEKAVSIDSTNIDYQSEYGTILDKKDLDNEAIKVYANIFNNNPKHTYSGIRLSALLVKKKNYAEAFKTFKKLYEEDPDCGYYSRYLGYCSIQDGKTRESIPWLKNAIKLDSTDLKAYIYIARVFQAGDVSDSAQHYLDLALRIYPENADIYVTKGDFYVTCNHHFQAVYSYTDALKLLGNSKESAGVRMNLGKSYYKTKRYEKALYYLLKASEEIVDVSLSTYLGHTYQALNKPDSSIIHYDFALKQLNITNRDKFDLLVDKAESLAMNHRYKTAVEVYKKAIGIEFNDTWANMYKDNARLEIAEIYHKNIKDRKQALVYYEKVLKGKEHYFRTKQLNYADKQYALLKEEMFMNGEL